MRRSRKIIRAVALAAGGAVLVSLIAVNLMLNTGGATKLVNSAQGDLTLTFDSAWSIWPGYVSARGLRILGHDSHLEWALTASKASAHIRLHNFFKMEFSASHATAEGVVWRARATRMLPELCKPASIGLPLLPELARPPTSADAEALEDCLKQTETAQARTGVIDPTKLWGVVLSEVAGSEIHEVWIEKLRFFGQLGVDGGFTLRPALRLVIDPTTVKISSGELLFGPDQVGNAIGLTAQLEIGGMSFVPGKENELLSSLSLSSTLAAHLNGVGFVSSFLSKASWLALKGGSGALSGQLAIDHGRLAPGTSIELLAKDLGAVVLENVASGSGRLHFGVKERSGKPLGDLELALSRYRLRRVASREDEIRGSAFRLSLETRDLALAELFKSFSASIHLGHATVPKLAVYNSYLPKSAGLSIGAGSATIAADLSIVESRIDDGRLQLSAGGLSFLYGAKTVAEASTQLRLRGDVELEVLFSKAELKQNAFGIPGSTINLRNVRLADQPADDDVKGWWGDMKVLRAELKPGGSPFFEGSMTTTLRDLQPILKIYAVKANLPGWVQGLLKAEGAKGSFDLQLSDDRVSIDHFLIEGKGLRAEALLHLVHGKPNGALLLSSGPLILGIDVRPDGTQLHLLDPTNNFYARTTEARAEWAAGSVARPEPTHRKVFVAP